MKTLSTAWFACTQGDRIVFKDAISNFVKTCEANEDAVSSLKKFHDKKQSCKAKVLENENKSKRERPAENYSDDDSGENVEDVP